MIPNHPYIKPEQTSAELGDAVKQEVRVIHDPFNYFPQGADDSQKQILHPTSQRVIIGNTSPLAREVAGVPFSLDRYIPSFDLGGGEGLSERDYLREAKAGLQALEEGLINAGFSTSHQLFSDFKVFQNPYEREEKRTEAGIVYSFELRDSADWVYVDTSFIIPSTLEYNRLSNSLFHRLETALEFRCQGSEHALKPSLGIESNNGTMEEALSAGPVTLVASVGVEKGLEIPMARLVAQIPIMVYQAAHSVLSKNFEDVAKRAGEIEEIVMKQFPNISSF